MKWNKKCPERQWCYIAPDLGSRSQMNYILSEPNWTEFYICWSTHLIGAKDFKCLFHLLIFAIFTIAQKLYHFQFFLSHRSSMSTTLGLISLEELTVPEIAEENHLQKPLSNLSAEENHQKPLRNLSVGEFQIPVTSLYDHAVTLTATLEETA